MADEPTPVEPLVTLEARIIRACPKHKDCPLDCKERKIEELGVIASIPRETA